MAFLPAKLVLWIWIHLWNALLDRFKSFLICVKQFHFIQQNAITVTKPLHFLFWHWDPITVSFYLLIPGNARGLINNSNQTTQSTWSHKTDGYCIMKYAALHITCTQNTHTHVHWHVTYGENASQANRQNCYSPKYQHNCILHLCFSLGHT